MPYERNASVVQARRISEHMTAGTIAFCKLFDRLRKQVPVPVVTSPRAECNFDSLTSGRSTDARRHQLSGLAFAARLLWSLFYRYSLVSARNGAGRTISSI